MSKNYKKLIIESLSEVQALGIKPGNITVWRINNRAKTRLGQCKKNPDGTYEIEIAKELLANENVSDSDVKEVIIHEILHSCRGCMSHTGTWRAYANLVNRAYGYDIERTKKPEEIGLDPVSRNQRSVKYVYICAVCGQQINRSRACNFTKNPGRYICGRCGNNKWKRVM